MYKPLPFVLNSTVAANCCALNIVSRNTPSANNCGVISDLRILTARVVYSKFSTRHGLIRIIPPSTQ